MARSGSYHCLTYASSLNDLKLKNPRHPSIGADGILCVHQVRCCHTARKTIDTEVGLRGAEYGSAACMSLVDL